MKKCARILLSLVLGLLLIGLIPEKSLAKSNPLGVISVDTELIAGEMYYWISVDSGVFRPFQFDFFYDTRVAFLNILPSSQFQDSGALSVKTIQTKHRAIVRVRLMNIDPAKLSGIDALQLGNKMERLFALKFENSSVAKPVIGAYIYRGEPMKNEMFYQADIEYTGGVK